MWKNVEPELFQLLFLLRSLDTVLHCKVRGRIPCRTLKGGFLTGFAITADHWLMDFLNWFGGRNRSLKKALESSDSVLGLPGGASGKEPRLPRQETEEMRVQSLGREDPWRRKWEPTPVFLLGESHGPRSQVGYGPWGCKESDWSDLAGQCAVSDPFSSSSGHGT